VWNSLNSRNGCMPKVTIIVPNYNHARFLDQRLRSVFGQRFQDFEVVLLDDASTDGSREILGRFADDPRVRTVVNERNTGNTFVQWNRGVALARGEYIWLAESDDFAEDTFLERLVPMLDADPRRGIAYCNVWITSDAGVTSRTFGQFQANTTGLTRWLADFTASGRDECARYFVKWNAIWNASAVLFRKSVFDAAGGAEESMRLCGDWMTWVKMLLISDLAYTAQPLSFFRCHDATVRARSRKNPGMAGEAYRVVRSIRRAVSVSKEDLEESCQYWFNAWLASVLATTNPLRQFRSFSVYLSALRVDPRLHARLWRALLSSAHGALGGIGRRRSRST
jgi:glycosyltransferase involved in cell wall biosynthesis